MTSFFSAECRPVWIKFRRLMQNAMSSAVMWSKSKPVVEFQYGRLLGEFNGMSSQSHMRRHNCRVKEFHPPYWKSFSPFLFFVFLCSFAERQLSYCLRCTCLTYHFLLVFHRNCSLCPSSIVSDNDLLVKSLRFFAVTHPSLVRGVFPWYAVSLGTRKDAITKLESLCYPMVTIKLPCCGREAARCFVSISMFQ